MPDIIFHIGFPKCASTTLQNQVFSQEEGYLGTNKMLPLNENYGKQFEFLTPTGPRIRGNLSGVIKIVTGIRKEYNDKFLSTNRFILSSELLTNRNKISDRPIILFLDKFQKKIWLFGKVKVLLVLRNPAQRIASGYAQVSYLNRKCSQSDFETYVDRELKENNLMNYDEWVSELFEKFGKENVCVLLTEDMGTNVFWEQLKDFCELKNLDIAEILSDSEKQNSRKVNNLSWSLRAFDPQAKARVLCNNIFAVVWPPIVAKSLRTKIYQMLFNIIKSFFEKRMTPIGKEKLTNIELTPEMIKRIQSAYDSQTRALSILLNRDLKPLGY